jgi:hypothetical protein
VDEFNRRLFWPRPDASDPPPGAADFFVDVGGASLHVRAREAREGLVTLLLFHGNGEVVADYDDAADDYADAGARLLVVDYRGYGRSTGTPTLDDLIDDASAVVDAIHERPLVVMGRSLGSAAAHEVCARDDVAGVVLESGFARVDGLFERRGQRPSDEQRARYDPLAKLARCRSPLLIMHGEDDELIDVEEAHLAFAAAGTKRKRIEVFAGFGHNDIARAPGYFRALKKLIEEVAS